VLLISILSPATQAGATTPDGQYHTYINYSSGLCITGIGVYNNQLSQQGCHGTVDQLWSLSTNTRSCCGYVYHQIISAKSGMCIGVRNGGTSQGDAVVEGYCNTANDQYWTLITQSIDPYNGQQLFIMANLGSGKCLRPSGGAGGYYLVQDDCSHSARLWGYYPA